MGTQARAQTTTHSTITQETTQHTRETHTPAINYQVPIFSKYMQQHSFQQFHQKAPNNTSLSEEQAHISTQERPIHQQLTTKCPFSANTCNSTPFSNFIKKHPIALP